MGYLCDFCGEQRSMVYCRSDAACLCLSCDRSVHSANALSKRHSRTLLCEKCNSQPAIVRCVEENLSLCQNCDWTGHGSSTSAAAHKRQTINCYSGCPSAAELSSIWSFVLDLPAAEGEACEKELVLMSINENSAKNSWDHSNDYNGQNAPNSAKHNDSISTGWAGSSPMPKLGSLPHLQNPPFGSSDITLPKLYCPGTKDAGGFCEGDVLDDDFNLEELDFDIENYEELFRVALNQSEELFENGGIDSLFRTKDIPAADSCCQSEVAPEEISVGPVNNAMQPACSTAASADSMMSTKTDSILYFNARQAHSSQPLSSHGGESSVGDWGASSMLPMGEQSWRPQCHESSTSIQSANRSNAVLRYQKKKKDRKFEKRVRYASRKARADVRRRVKGRFVKAGEAYDYDPLSQTRSY